jgi:hypothetical protein
MTFLISEDEALRNLLKDMVVTDQKATGNGTPRKVGVWFGQPDQELRDQSYPYITIDMIDIGEEVNRAMRGRVKPDYLDNPVTMVQSVQGVQSVQSVQGVQGVQSAQGVQFVQTILGVQRVQGIQGVQGLSYTPTTHNWDISYPIPIRIDYQITTYARQPRHDRELLAQLLYKKIPLRFAVLQPDDGTVRRLDVLDVSKRDVTESGKRLFVNAITVRVSSEIAPETYNQLYKALEINVTGTTGTQVIGRGQFTAIDPITISQP